MKKMISIMGVVLVLFGIYALAKTHSSSSNFPSTHYTMDNGTTAHTILAFDYEDSNEYTTGLWRPYDASANTIYYGDIWVCKTSGTPRAVYTVEGYTTYPGWHNLDGNSGLWRPGEAGWPAGEPVMSDHDTCATFSADGIIGLQLIRHSMMWDAGIDADYFINGY